MSRFRLTTVSKSWIFLPIVLGLIVFAFFPVFKADFVQWDDNVHILDNPAIKSLNQDYIKKIFTETVNDIYIPLTSLSFALEYRFFGFDPFVFHLDNLLLHLGIVLFLFWIVREMGVSAFGAAVAALLFGIHPMHVESVAWVTERKDVLYGIFYAAAVLSYIKYLKSVSSNNSQIHKQRYLVLTTILGFLSILAKPMALSLPLVLLLMDWFFRWSFTRRTFIEKVPLCLLVGLAVWVTYKSFVRVPGTEAAESLLIWPWTLAFYLRQFFFPFFSVPIYRLPEPITFSNMEYLFSLIFTGVLAASLWVLRKCRWYLFAVLFFFFSIFFLLRFDASHDTNIVADRFMYLPSLGLCAFLGFGLDRIWQNVHAYKIRAAIFGLAIIFVTGVLGFKTFQQAQIWDNSVALWKHQLKYFPGEKIALNNLATVLRDEKEYKDAVEEYKKILKLKAEGADVQLSLSARQQMAKVQELVFYYTRAIETDDRFSDAYYNLGTLYKEMGHIPLALANYQRIVDIDPLYKDVYMGLGDLFREMGDAKNAVDAYQQTIKTSPDDEDVYFNVIDAINEALKEDPENIFYTQARRDLFADYVKLIEKSPDSSSLFNLANMYGQMKEYDRAESAYLTALDRNPQHAGILYNLGNLYKDLGRPGEAISMYERALKINKNEVNIYINLGVIYGRLNQFEKAMAIYRSALEIAPENDKVYFNLAYAEEMGGRLREAVEAYQKSLALNPDQAEAYYNLGNLYARLRQNDKARKAYLQALQLDPQHLDAAINMSILSFQMKDFDAAVKYCDEAVFLGYSAPESYLRALAPYR